MTLNDFLSRQKHGESDAHEIIPISFNMQEVLHARYYNIHENGQKRYLIQIRSQAKGSGTVLPNVHGVDKRVGPNVRPEKQIIKSLVTPVQSHFSTESKDQYHVKPRMDQGRACIKKKMFRFPIPLPCNKPEQPKLLPGRRPIIQIAERPLLQPPWIVAQPKTISIFPLKEKSIFPERSVQDIDQVVQVPKSIVPKIVSEHVKKILNPDDPVTRSKQEMRCRISEGKNQLMLIQFTGPHPNQLKLSSLDQDIKIDFEENSPHQEHVKNHLNCKAK